MTSAPPIVPETVGARVQMPATVTGERHFPPPWKVEELEACFFVTDGGGQKLAFVYFEDDPGRRSAAKLHTKDEARRIAVNDSRYINFP